MDSIEDQKPKQEELFPISKYPAVDVETKPRWYYITTPRGEHMLTSHPDYGLAWMPTDLQYEIPHLFNSAPAAHRKAKTMDIPCIVKLYPFSSIWK